MLSFHLTSWAILALYNLWETGLINVPVTSRLLTPIPSDFNKWRHCTPYDIPFYLADKWIWTSLQGHLLTKWKGWHFCHSNVDNILYSILAGIHIFTFATIWCVQLVFAWFHIVYKTGKLKPQVDGWNSINSYYLVSDCSFYLNLAQLWGYIYKYKMHFLNHNQKIFCNNTVLLVVV